MKIGIFASEIKDTGFSYTRKISEKLATFSEVYYHSSMKSIGGNSLYLDNDDFYRQCDVIVSHGGDGTLLMVAHNAAPYKKPVLGVNLGRLGFLTGCEKEFFLGECYKLLSGDFRTEERMMIEAEIISETGKKKSVYALNDIVIKRAEFVRTENIDIYIDNDMLGNYLADGIIISTPTGSTAYSLSAGGPIADPELDAMIITPICPHLLRARPIVVPSNKIITLSKPSGSEFFSAIAADGQESFTFDGSVRVVVKKSKNKARLIRLDGNSFYNLVSEKLK